MDECIRSVQSSSGGETRHRSAPRAPADRRCERLCRLLPTSYDL